MGVKLDPNVTARVLILKFDQSSVLGKKKWIVIARINVVIPKMVVWSQIKGFWCIYPSRAF